MKKTVFHYFGLLTLVIALAACSDKPAAAKPKKESLVEVKDGIYTEYYPGRKAVKFKGPQNKAKHRDGRWFYYDEKGNEMSMTEYTDGQMNGFIFVRYPNGSMRYTGEYTMGKESGLWRFYKPDGSLEIEKDYGKVE